MKKKTKTTMRIRPEVAARIDAAVKPQAVRPSPGKAVAITPITYNKAARSYATPKAAPSWRASVSGGGHQGVISDDNDPTGRTIALTYDPKDADPIARAVNAHASLVDFIRKLADDMDTLDFHDVAEAARATLRAAGESA